MILRDVYSYYNEGADHLLYQLLGERTQDQSISHKKMPTMEEHRAFIKSHPYKKWWLLYAPDVGYVGSIYISKQREVGIAIFQKYQKKGYGKEALELLRQKFPGKLVANINPKNEQSKRFFESEGFTLRQHTYVYE
jgi:RimJ/RimL family protein N-acetyltransferase